MNTTTPLGLSLAPLPPWLADYAILHPPSAHAHAARFTLIVSQLLPSATQGLDEDERPVVETLLFARLMLDAGALPAHAAVLGLLDVWLAGSVLRLGRWTPGQRRAWWQVEKLSIVAEILSRWTRRHVLPATPDELAAHKTEINQLAACWVECSQLARAAGPEVAALYTLEISESLLDCARAFGLRAHSLRGAALRSHPQPDSRLPPLGGGR